MALVSLVGATRAPPCCHREALRLNSMAEQRGRLSLDKKKEKKRAQKVSTCGLSWGRWDVETHRTCDVTTKSPNPYAPAPSGTMTAQRHQEARAISRSACSVRCTRTRSIFLFTCGRRHIHCGTHTQSARERAVSTTPLFCRRRLSQRRQSTAGDRALPATTLLALRRRTQT